MEKEIFDKFRQLVYEKSGITLREGKESMVSARISKRMRALGLSDHDDYFQLVSADESGSEAVELLDAISTNITHFFREPQHFEFLEKAVAGWRAQGQRRFRFWSAACSSGEEPYSMAMTLRETARTSGVDLKILATDISTRVLKLAMAGVYTEERLKNVSEDLRELCFRKSVVENEHRYEVKSEFKTSIVFRRLNLAEPPYPMHGPLDVIFCRNVMIYFDDQVRRRLLANMFDILKPGGYLMVGHAESLTGMVSKFKTVVPSIYVKA